MAFKASADKHGHHSLAATETFARATREVEFALLVIENFLELRKIA